MSAPAGLVSRVSRREETTMPFQPVDSRRLYEQVADQIGGLVRRGEFTPGSACRRSARSGEDACGQPVGRARGDDRARDRRADRSAHGLGRLRREKPAERGETVNTGQSPSDILNARMLIEGEIAALAASVRPRRSRRDGG